GPGAGRGLVSLGRSRRGLRCGRLDARRADVRTPLLLAHAEEHGRGNEGHKPAHGPAWSRLVEGLSCVLFPLGVPRGDAGASPPRRAGSGPVEAAAIPSCRPSPRRATMTIGSGSRGRGADALARGPASAATA